MRTFIFSILTLCVTWSFQSCAPKQVEVQTQIEKAPVLPVERMDRPNAPILKGVKVPAGNSYFISSGTVANILDENAESGTPERYGDTYTQSVSALRRLQGVLQETGLTLKDVVQLRVYLVPDNNNDNQIDFQAWFKAYGEFFNNEENPNKVARTTLGVPALANPDLLVEIEIVAVYPVENFD